MKLCWENLEHLILMGNYNLTYYDNVETQEGYHGNYDISKEKCIYCNNYYLECNYGETKYFCDKECKQKDKEERKKREAEKKKNKIHGLKGKTRDIQNNKWVQGIPKDKTYYNNYKDRMQWFTDIRRDPLNNSILQTKCCICDKWFSPKRNRVYKVVHFAEGRETQPYDHTWGFYCSKECTDKCEYFGKPYWVIILEDRQRNLFNNRHNIPDEVAFYDWQKELKKVLQIEITRQKNIEREKKRYHKERKKTRPIRRRKKREAELKRTNKKRKRKKLLEQKRKKREKYLKSEEYIIDTHLKWMLYRSRQRSKIKKWEHNIDFEWLKENLSKKCPKCRINFRYDTEIKMDPFAPSIDRINPNIGYTKDNCQITSWMYNCGKNSYNEKTLYIICREFLNFSTTILLIT